MFKVLQVKSYITGDVVLVLSRVVCFLFLAIMSVSDLKRRSVSVRILIWGTIFAVISCINIGYKSPLVSLCGGGLGMLFLLVSKVTEEQLGYGDSWLLCILGLYLGIWKFTEVLMLIWGITIVVAVCIVIRKGSRRRVSIPMIPLITLGYIAFWIGEVV